MLSSREKVISNLDIAADNGLILGVQKRLSLGISSKHHGNSSLNLGEGNKHIALQLMSVMSAEPRVNAIFLLSWFKQNPPPLP
jgi:hypothetical protein